MRLHDLRGLGILWRGDHEAVPVVGRYISMVCVPSALFVAHWSGRYRYVSRYLESIRCGHGKLKGGTRK